VPENSVLGVQLQLGGAGLAVLLAAVASVFAGVARGGWRAPGDVAIASAGAATAGLLVGATQSYFTSPGNVATLSVWICLQLTAGAAGVRADADR